jgi:hypothetical protein
VHRPFCAADASNQVARVELLAGGAAQERQELNLGRALPKPSRASQCPHVLDTNTIVLVSDTRLFELFLAARERGRGERDRGHRAEQRPRGPETEDLHAVSHRRRDGEDHQRSDDHGEAL